MNNQMTISLSKGKTIYLALGLCLISCIKSPEKPKDKFEIFVEKHQSPGDSLLSFTLKVDGIDITNQAFQSYLKFDNELDGKFDDLVNSYYYGLDPVKKYELIFYHNQQEVKRFSVVDSVYESQTFSIYSFLSPAGWGSLDTIFTKNPLDTLVIGKYNQPYLE